MSRIIENVTLAEIRPGDFAQLYKWSERPEDSIWLTGYNRAANVNVGDRGRFVYKSTASQGLWWFEKETEKQ